MPSPGSHHSVEKRLTKQEELKLLFPFWYVSDEQLELTPDPGNYNSLLTSSFSDNYM